MNDFNPAAAFEVLKNSNVAIARLIPGYEFVGAWGEAKTFGYEKGTPAFELFCSLYYNDVKDLKFETIDNVII